MPRLTSRLRASVFFPKSVGHSQLPDLGVQLLHLLPVDLWLLSGAALEHTGRTVAQSTFPLMDQRRMHPEPARQLGLGFLALQGFHRDLRLELSRIGFWHDGNVVGSQDCILINNARRSCLGAARHERPQLPTYPYEIRAFLF